MSGDGDGETGVSWATWAGVGGAVLAAIVMLVLLPTYLREGATDGDAIWLNGFALLFGVLAFWGGWGQFRRRQLIRNTPTSKVRSLAVGAAEVKGEAHPVDEPVVSPLTHQEACMYELEVEEYHQDDDGGDWDTVLRMEEKNPFHLDDGTAAVRVEPQEAELHLEVEEKVLVDDHDRPPAALGEWAERQGIVEDADAAQPEGLTGKLKDMVASEFESGAERHLVGASNDDRRYTEKVLAVGEDTYVFGGAQPLEGAASKENARNLVMRSDPGTETFIVSDLSEGELVGQKLAFTVALLSIAIALLAYGFLGSLRWFGLL